MVEFRMSLQKYFGSNGARQEYHLNHGKGLGSGIFKTILVILTSLSYIANNLCMWLFFFLDGYSYEKEAMENWISKKKRTSPMTNLVLSSVILIPNRTLKMAIDRWLSETHQK